jgi:hypothetical protein
VSNDLINKEAHISLARKLRSAAGIIYHLPKSIPTPRFNYRKDVDELNLSWSYADTPLRNFCIVIHGSDLIRWSYTSGEHVVKGVCKLQDMSEIPIFKL